MPVDYDRIREVNLREYGEGTRHLAFLSRLYSDRTHFIFELLQNAEDAGATRIRFELSTDGLRIRHDGRPFDRKDVEGICGIDAGTKGDDLTKIGKFGIGFKSVYSFTATPEVHSGDEHFRIELYVRPWAAPPIAPGRPWSTLFVLPFDCPSTPPAQAHKEIAQGLRSLDLRSLLFLRSIEEVEWCVDGTESGSYRRDVDVDRQMRRVSITGMAQEASTRERWLIFDRPVSSPTGECHLGVEVGFRLETSRDGGSEGVAAIHWSPLFAFFPTARPMRLGFLLQGPYRTTPARDNVPLDDAWNRMLIEETASLLDTALDAIRDMGLLTVGFLTTLPLRAEDFPPGSTFHPLFDRVREALRHRPLLPTEAGGFVSAGEAALARGAGIKELLSPDQVRSLLGDSEPRHWLSSLITQDKCAELRRYLLDQQDVPEITPEAVARRLTGEFLERQSDEWMVRLYAFASGLESLWRRHPWRPTEDGPLRQKPLIRLADGRQVCPFKDDRLTPTAYLPCADADISLPFVKHSIAAVGDAKEFLRRLGFSEPDVFNVVMERVMPKYNDADHAAAVGDREHEDDVRKILVASQTVSRSRRETLIGKLAQSRWVRSTNCATGEQAFRRACEVYAPNADLAEYFSGNPDAWFVDGYAPEVVEELKELGVATCVRVKVRQADACGCVQMACEHGNHIRGLNGFDGNRDVDGLAHALASPTEEKARFIWNKLLCPNSAQIRGTLESSTRQDFRPSTRQTEFSCMGKTVHDLRWVPSAAGGFHRPCELRPSQLPEGFERQKQLIEALSLRPEPVEDETRRHATALGITVEDADLVRQHPEEFARFRDGILHKAGRPEFPIKVSPDRVRRQEKIREDAGVSPPKESAIVERSVRVSKPAVDPITWLREQYTNDDGAMVCQLCQYEMPFLKRDGKHYFEAVQISDNMQREYHALYLALCPVCAAKFKEFVKVKDQPGGCETLLQDVRRAAGSGVVAVQVQLGLAQAELRFVEDHIQDMSTFLSHLASRQDSPGEPPA